MHRCRYCARIACPHKVVFTSLQPDHRCHVCIRCGGCVVPHVGTRARAEALAVLDELLRFARSERN